MHGLQLNLERNREVHGIQSAPAVYLDKPRRSVQRREEVGKEIILARGRSLLGKEQMEAKGT
jgi:hypothetical protein